MAFKMSNVFKFFGGFGLFRKSRNKAKRSMTPPPVVETPAEDADVLVEAQPVLKNVQRHLLVEIADNADIGNVYKLDNQDIDVDMLVEEDFETVGTYVVKAMHQHTIEEINAAEALVEKHMDQLPNFSPIQEMAGDESVPADLRALRMRAAYFAHHGEFLEQMDIPKDAWPKKLLDDQALNDIKAESVAIGALQHKRQNAEFLVTHMFGFRTQDYADMEALNFELAQRMKVSEANHEGDTPFDVFEAHTQLVENNAARDAAAALGKLAQYHEKHKNALPSQEELKSWAKDPALQDMPMVQELAKRFGIEPLSPEDRVQMEAEMKGYTPNYDLESDNHMMDVICTSDISQAGFFAQHAIHPDTLLGMNENGMPIGETVASVAAKTYMAAAKELDSVLDTLDDNTQRVFDDYMIMQEDPNKDINYQRAAILLSHQTILEALNVPKEQWPEQYISHKGVSLIDTMLEKDKKALDARYMIAHVIGASDDRNFKDKFKETKPNLYGDVPADIMESADVICQNKMNMLFPDRHEFQTSYQAVSMEVADSLSNDGLFHFKQQIAEWKKDAKISGDFKFLANVNEQEIKVGQAPKVEAGVQAEYRWLGNKPADNVMLPVTLDLDVNPTNALSNDDMIEKLDRMTINAFVGLDLGGRKKKEPPRPEAAPTQYEVLQQQKVDSLTSQPVENPITLEFPEMDAPSTPKVDKSIGVETDMDILKERAAKEEANMLSANGITLEFPTISSENDIVIGVNKEGQVSAMRYNGQQEAYEQFESFQAPNIKLNYTVKPKV